MLQSVFLPQGYPESVSDDYIRYQVWDTIQVSVVLVIVTVNVVVQCSIKFVIDVLVYCSTGILLQAFSSSITSSLATQAVLRGVGVGDEGATVMAATITWLLKGLLCWQGLLYTLTTSMLSQQLRCRQRQSSRVCYDVGSQQCK